MRVPNRVTFSRRLLEALQLVRDCQLGRLVTTCVFVDLVELGEVDRRYSRLGLPRDVLGLRAIMLQIRHALNDGFVPGRALYLNSFDPLSG